MCVDIVVHLELILRGHCEPQVCRKRLDLVAFSLSVRVARCWEITHTLYSRRSKHLVSLWMRAGLLHTRRWSGGTLEPKVSELAIRARS